MYFSHYSSTSPSSSPISIGGASSASSASSFASTSSTSSTFSREDNYAKGMSCAFPSWPKGDQFRSFQSGAPSSSFSDAELFADDLELDADVPLLHEAPAPPRYQPVVAMPLLPLYASEQKPKKKRRSSRKHSRPAQPMTPIAESPANGG